MSIATATLPAVSSASDLLRMDGIYTWETNLSRIYIKNFAQGRGITFSFQGGSVSVGCTCSIAAGLTLTVDGTPVASNVIILNTWAPYVFSGFADDGTIHTAVLTLNTSGFNYVDTGTGTTAIPILVTSILTAAIISPGGIKSKILPFNFPLFYQQIDGTIGGTVVCDGATNIDPNNSNILMSPCKGIRFKSSTTSVTIMCLWLATLGRYALYADGGSTPVADNVSAGAFGTYNIVSVAAGLSGTHEYQLVCYAGDSQYLSYVEIDAGTLINQSHTAYPNEVWDGDSIVAGLGVKNADMAIVYRDIDCYIVSRALGNWPIIHGSAGANVYTYLRDHYTDLNSTNMPQLTTPVRVWLEGGTNDCFSGVATATFQTAYHDYITNFQSLWAGVPVICRQIFDTTRQTQAQLNVYRALQAAGAAGISGVTVVSTTGWFDPTNGAQTADGLHPSAGGYAVIAPHEIALFSSGPVPQSDLNGGMQTLTGGI